MVFNDRKFIIVRNNTEPVARYESLEALVTANGGEIVAWDERADVDVSPKLVIIAGSMDYERADEMKRFMIPTVTEDWVHACIQERKLVPMRPYSPDPRNFMRDVMACFSQLTPGDTDVFKAGIRASGGDFTDLVTRYTSHVVATILETPEVQIVLQSRENNNSIGIRLVRPEWLDVCMKLQCKVDDGPYLLDAPQTSDTQSTQDLTGTFPLKDSPRLAVQQSMRESLGSNILDGRRFYLGDDLGLSDKVGKTVTYLIETNGGVIEPTIENAQVYLGKWREGSQYIKASRLRIVVGNITWLYWLMIHQKFEKPTHLLHYPEVKGGLTGMRDLRICITNYTGDARAYLQSLIQSMGATYSGKLVEKNTTHLITAYPSGQKYDAAKKWGIPIVNHLWLEDSYAYWHRQDEESRIYSYFPPKLSMSTLIGTRHLVQNVLQKFQNPDDLGRGEREHHKRQAKQRAGDWLHDAMIIEGEYHKKLRRGKLPPLDAGQEQLETLNRKLSSSPPPASPSPVQQHQSEHVDAASPHPPPRSKESTGAATVGLKLQSRDNSRNSSPSPARSDPPHQNGKAAINVETPRSNGHVPRLGTASPSSTATSSSSQSVPLRVMFSGVDEPPSNKECAKIGLSAVKSAPVNVLVAPRFLKTVKFLQSLAETEEFVDPLWIETSISAGQIVDMKSFRINDPQLTAALERRAHLGGRGLFDGLKFRLDPELRDKTTTFRDLIKAHKGQLSGRSMKEPVIEVGNKDGQVPFEKFISAIQHMDASLLDT